MEIPYSLPINLKGKILRAREKVFKYRLDRPSDEIVNEIFLEFKNILKELDEYLWKKEVHISYY